MRQRLPHSTPGQQPGTFHSDGDRRPSRGTDGSRYPRFVPSSSRPGLWQHRLRGVQGGRHPPCPGCVVVSPASVALARRPFHARRAVLHDLDAALPGRLRRGRCACPPPPLAPRAYRGFRPHRRPLRVCRTRLHFADRLRAGAGRRSWSGRRQGARVCWGRPLLSRPRGAVGFGLAAVESAAAGFGPSVVALTCGVCVVGGFGWL
jgi:hypothetical protein